MGSFSSKAKAIAKKQSISEERARHSRERRTKSLQEGQEKEPESD